MSETEEPPSTWAALRGRYSVLQSRRFELLELDDFLLSFLVEFAGVEVIGFEPITAEGLAATVAAAAVLVVGGGDYGGDVM